MLRKVLCVITSVVLLSAGWLGGSGLTLIAGLVPLLYISSLYGSSARDWWRMAGWAALTLLLWNAATIWWVWIASPLGPITAGLFSSFWNMTAFMLYHYVSKRASKAVAYTLLTTAWVATEFFYTSAEVLSFPWLTLGNGFCSWPWAVQWYEWTGVLGGSVWVVICNLAIFEALRSRTVRSAVRAALLVVVPLAVSGVMYARWQQPEQSVRIAVVQPNVDCYEEKFSGTDSVQTKNLLSLMDEVPRDVQIIAMPETALPEQLNDADPQSGAVVRQIRERIDSLYPKAMVVAGASTVRLYLAGEPHTVTARTGQGYYYDIYNSAVAVNGDTQADVHHKMRLLIGVEAMPFPKLLRWLSMQSVDLGGVTGQLGRSNGAVLFEKDGVKIGPSICYEGVYGDCFAQFVREGAEVMIVVSNDGWWGNTAGHKRLFDLCRLRAVETRRNIARSANTGVSGFINSRGDVGQTLTWGKRGVLTDNVGVQEGQTLYVRYGDWVGRLSVFVAVLCLLYFSAYRIKLKNHLVN